MVVVKVLIYNYVNWIIEKIIELFLYDDKYKYKVIKYNNLEYNFTLL